MLILVTDHLPHQPRSDSVRRWGLETLLGVLKTRSFCRELTHFTDSARLSQQTHLPYQNNVISSSVEYLSFTDSQYFTAIPDTALDSFFFTFESIFHVI